MTHIHEWKIQYGDFGYEWYECSCGAKTFCPKPKGPKLPELIDLTNYRLRQTKDFLENKINEIIKTIGELYGI